ncbi:hypothetical protein DFH09DRAFT_826444, partial [Mycena vulgaris]
LETAGMGKPSLATALIHHAEIAVKYARRYFVPHNSATTHGSLSSAVASHLGPRPEPPPDIAKIIVRHLSAGLPVLLVLNTLKTPWEPTSSRRDVEESLALL